MFTKQNWTRNMQFSKPKFTGNGYFNHHELDGKLMESGWYWVLWPDTTVTCDKVTLKKEPYQYNDTGHTYSAEHQNAYVTVEVHGKEFEIPVDGLKFVRNNDFLEHAKAGTLGFNPND